MTILHDGDTHSSAAAAAPVSKEEAKEQGPGKEQGQGQQGQAQEEEEEEDDDDDDEKQHPLAGSAHSSGSSGIDGFEVVGQRCVLFFVSSETPSPIYLCRASTPPCLLP